MQECPAKAISWIEDDGEPLGSRSENILLPMLLKAIPQVQKQNQKTMMTGSLVSKLWSITNKRQFQTELAFIILPKRKPPVKLGAFNAGTLRSKLTRTAGKAARVNRRSSAVGVILFNPNSALGLIQKLIITVRNLATILRNIVVCVVLRARRLHPRTANQAKHQGNHRWNRHTEDDG